MQFAAEDEAERKRIKRDLVLPGDYRQSRIGKILRPLSRALIVIRQDNSVRPVPHPVHELQRLEIESIVCQMIFDQHVPPADAARFGQEFLDSVRVMQNVDEHADIKRA